jgi:hypothetical protein
MAAPIFKFKSIRRRLETTNPVLIYGVITGAGGVDAGTLPTEISTVVLTVQITNTTGSVARVSVLIEDADGTYSLVNAYPVPPNNAFDPLTGNLVLTTGSRLICVTDSPNGVDVTLSLLEIANATAF